MIIELVIYPDMLRNNATVSTDSDDFLYEPNCFITAGDPATALNKDPRPRPLLGLGILELVSNHSGHHH